ncbi:MAG: hypothetical protein Q8N53_08385 [Longimicrobiales bacterium]|nr:hypothetical protein [Longimicrobiales bacterium]
MMKSLLRKLRGVLGTGLTWAAAWSVAGTILQGGLALLGIARAPDIAVAPFMWGLMGFYGGSMFGALLSLTEGRRTLEKLRIGRVAGWGALAGFAVPIVYNLMRGDPNAISMMLVLTNAVIVAPLSAASAAGMTALAQRAAPASLGSGGEAVPLPSDAGAVKLLD